MAQTVSEFLLARLQAWGVRRIFGYPGDGINGIIGALRHFPELQFVQARHEEMAAFMACAHAKFTGQVGVCLATSGPGAIHLLNGLYDAKLDHQPVVAIVGQTDRAAMGGSFQQEVDLQSLFKDVASEYVQTCMEPSQIRTLVDRAVRIARAERNVTCIIIPKDVQELTYQAPAHKHGTVHTSLGFHSPRVIPHEEGLRRAADILNGGQKVAMLVGQGAAGCDDEIAQVADLLGCGVAKALLGRAVLDDRLPWVTGAIGLLGTKPSWDLMMGCDTLLMVGSNFPYAEFLPEEGHARGVQIDIDGRLLGLRYANDVNLCGDAKETLTALIPHLKYKADRAWRNKIERDVGEWWKVVEARAMVEARPVNPERVFWELSPLLPDGAVVTCDSGTSASWWARDLKIRRGMMASLSGTLATMGPGLPYAFAAKMAHPERCVIACVGDGAMQMNGNNVLITIEKYWREWRDPRLITLVLKNRDLNMVTWELRVSSGQPKLEASQNLPDFPYAQYAESIGLHGIKIERPDQIVPAWREALASRRPAVIEAVVDPEVPPLPPHITVQQAASLTQAVLKHDPNWRHMVRQIYKEVVEGWVRK